MFARIKAIASYLPAQIEENSEIVDARFMKKIGVKSRHIATDESAGDLAFKAAERLFAENNIDRHETNFILLCTQHPDYQIPHTAAQLQDRLGLGKNVGAMDIGLGCSGYVYGLAVAKGLIETGLAKKILFLTSSVYTKYINVKDTSLKEALQSKLFYGIRNAGLLLDDHAGGCVLYEKRDKVEELLRA